MKDSTNIKVITSFKTPETSILLEKLSCFPSHTIVNTERQFKYT